MTDAELARMERLLGDGKVDLDVSSYIRMARELLAEVHRQRGLVEQTADTITPPAEQRAESSGRRSFGPPEMVAPKSLVCAGSWGYAWAKLADSCAEPQ